MSQERLARLRDVVRVGAEYEVAEKALGELAERYDTHGWPPVAPDYTFGAAPSDAGAGRKLDPAFLLFQLDHMDTALVLEQSPSSVPLIGPLIDVLKRPLHQLFLFYLNRVAAQSATANLLQAALIQQLWRELQAVKEVLAGKEKAP